MIISVFLTIVVFTVTEKPGKCIQRYFIALACRPDEIVKRCTDDGDCPGTKKCCQTERCVTACEEPAGKVTPIA